jgi:prolyl oligopeptidase
VPPTARIDVVREERFGISLADPYRWMEAEDQELEGWLAGQGEHAAAVLGALPGRAALLARVTELTSAAAADFAFTPAGERMFFLRQPPGGGVPVLMMDDEILLDPSALTGAGHWNLDWFVPALTGAMSPADCPRAARSKARCGCSRRAPVGCCPTRSPARSSAR